MFFRFKFIILVNFVFFLGLANVNAETENPYEQIVQSCEEMLKEKGDYAQLKPFCDAMKESCKIMKEFNSNANPEQAGVAFAMKIQADPKKQQELQKCTETIAKFQQKSLEMMMK